MSTRRFSTSNTIPAAVFCLAIALPLVGMMVPSLEIVLPIHENRNLSGRPPLEWPSLAEYPAEFETFFNDRFGFRSFLIHADNRLRFEVFGVSGSPKVMVGRKGWLYFTGEQAIDDHRGVNPLTRDELDRWRNVLKAKRIWLASRGIEYLLVIAPNKSTVYPEFLPPGINRASGDTPADQLVSRLAEDSEIRVLDLREAMKAVKSEDRTFYRLDTHWNTLGAYFASAAIVDEVNGIVPGCRPLSLDRCNRKTLTRQGGDLASMLGLQGYLVEESPHLVVADPASRVVGERGAFKDPFTMEVPVEGLPRVLMFRDSFATAMIPFLAESFGRIRFQWERWNRHADIEEILGRPKPDIVIEEIVERALTSMEYVTIDEETIPPAPTSRLLADLDLSPSGVSAFSPVKHASIKADIDGMVVTSTGRDPGFLLPVIDARDFQIHLDMDSPVTSSVQLFYQTGEEPFFDERKSARVRTEPGMNTIKVSVDDPGFNGVIRIDPGSVPGSYVFRKIEIRKD